MNKPNFFIVGAPKCGTTALSEYLKSHPNVYLSSPKEPHYFAEDFNHTQFKTLDKYLELFAGQGDCQVVGEASVHYLCSAVALANIYDFNPEAKIIAMLRNPVELVYSYHSQLLYNTGEDEPSFEKAWRLQATRQLGNNIPKRCANPRVLQYQEIASLGSQVEKLLQIFPASQVKLVLFEDFKASPAKVYQEVLAFLELPPDNRTKFPKVNANRSNKITWLGILTEKTPAPLIKTAKVAQTVLGVKTFGIMNRLRNLNTSQQERQTLSPTFRAELTEAFREESQKLAQILQRDLSDWLV